MSETREQWALRLVRDDLEWLAGWGDNFSPDVVAANARSAIEKIDAVLAGNLSESKGGAVIYPSVRRDE